MFNKCLENNEKLLFLASLISPGKIILFESNIKHST